MACTFPAAKQGKHRSLAAFIRALDAYAQASGKNLHIVVHGMGNRVLRAALQWLVLKNRVLKVADKIAGTAPDEGAADFVTAMADVRTVGSRRTLDAASKDKPVCFSEMLLS